MVSTTPPGAYYASREKFRAMLDFKESARNDQQVDQALAAATSSVEKQLRRSFFPYSGSRSFDWPGGGPSTPWRLWMDGAELLTVDQLTAGGVTIPDADIVLYPDSGPPYNRIEINLSSNSAFHSGSTRQNAITVRGVFGYWTETAPIGVTAEALDATETSVDVSRSAGVGVGDVIKVDSEHMVVTGRSWLSTGQALQAALPAQVNAVTVLVPDGSAFAVGETLLLDAERVTVVDIAGNSLIVKRAADGSVLAAHSGSTVYAPRTLTVTRDALTGAHSGGTSHTMGAAVVRCLVPGVVEALTLAEAALIYQGGASGWSTGGSSGSATLKPNPAVTALRQHAKTAVGAGPRSRAV